MDKKIFMIPTTDFSFKRIFGTETNKRFLIHFLNSFVAAYTGEIADITYLPTEHYGMTEAEHKVVFDILCEDTCKRKFIIEMQRARQPEYKYRSIFYLARTISSSMMAGEKKYYILPAYSVNILDFDIPEYKNNGESFWAIFLKDQKNRVLTEKVGVFYMNLCNFAAQQADVTDEMRAWLNVLKNMPEMGDEEYAAQDDFFRSLLDECRISKLDNVEKESYNKSVLEYEDVKQAIALAAKESFDEGIEQGKAEGIAEGIAKGREEALLQTAKNLLELGMSAADIAKVTGVDLGDRS